MVIIKKIGIKYLITLITFMLALTACGKNNIENSNKSIDIYYTVKEAFLTDQGYSEVLSKHISEEVFKKINIYNVYAVNNPEYKRPFKVEFHLEENSQEIKKDIIYVKMTYSVTIADYQGKAVGGSKDVPITFTVKRAENDWYIIDKDEPA